YATNFQILRYLTYQPLGYGYDSGGYWARFTFQGKQWDGIFLVGTAYFGSDSPYWLLYYSYIAVPSEYVTASSRRGLHAAKEDRSFQRELIGESLAQSLMDSWRSWRVNPSAQNARFQTMKM